MSVCACVYMHTHTCTHIFTQMKTLQVICIKAASILLWFHTRRVLYTLQIAVPISVFVNNDKKKQFLLETSGSIL